jgi:asparagine synthase (glutamine-hydrolysing)
MCGISGILSKSPISIQELVGMNNLISHRGPDDEGYVLFNEDASLIFGGQSTPLNIYQSTIPYCPDKRILEDPFETKAVLGLGHRRLAIVDLSEAGHQPMSYDNGRYWIVYNGEIYNYLELRQELETLGLAFHSNTDTEVVLAAYAYWGSECLSRFNGMWAFSIFDLKTHKLFFARDRFGIKPFYYWYAPDGALFFGSEIKQFTANKDWKAFLNKQRAIDYLAWGLTDHTDETLFDGVYQLRAGHFISIKVDEWSVNSGRLHSKNWYKVKKETVVGSIGNCAIELKEKLFDSMKLHLRSDVPIGSCLSGGLDSSSIVCIANDLLKKSDSALKQKTFSVCAVEERFNERKWMEEIENNFNIEAHYIYPSLLDLFKSLPKILWHQDEPFGSTSIYAQWSVFSAASKDGVKVMLDGQGADEQLAGYYDYFALRFRSLFYSYQWITLIKEMRATKAKHHFSMLHITNLLLSGITPSRLKEAVKKVMHFGKKNGSSWLNADDDISYDYPFKFDDSSPKTIREFSEQQLSRTNLQMLLHWEDRNSMAHSIESRVPFLDYRLVDFCLNIPDEYKISGGITKRILRLAMKNILPPAICNRMDKMGFVTPEELWITKENPNLFRAKLDDSLANTCDLVNQDVKRILEDMITGKRKFDFKIWRIICFSEWVKCFSVKVRLQ